jgi:hypothetical protein
VSNLKADEAHIFLLLVDVTDLEPDVFFCQRGWWNRNDISETLEVVNTYADSALSKTYLKTLLVFLLLLVNYAKPEINFICLLEVGLHSHYLRECLLGVLKRSISII